MDRRSAITLASLAGLAACFPRNAPAQQKTIVDQVVGLWKLTSHANKVVGTDAVEYPFGKHPTSYQLFGRGGEMLNLIIGEGRKAPADRTMITDAEKAALFNTCVAQIGTYEVEGNKIRIHYIATLSQVQNDSDRTYMADISGNKLTLTASPFLQRATGHQVITIRTLERAT